MTETSPPEPKRHATFDSSDSGDESDDRERWPSRTAFYLAAVGGAVGFGNVWRFPALAKDYGGGVRLLLLVFVALLNVTTLHTMCLILGALSALMVRSIGFLCTVSFGPLHCWIARLDSRNFDGAISSNWTCWCVWYLPCSLPWGRSLKSCLCLHACGLLQHPFDMGDSCILRILVRRSSLD
jgi:Sodium:neurotransmitter symporter family